LWLKDGAEIKSLDLYEWPYIKANFYINNVWISRNFSATVKVYMSFTMVHSYVKENSICNILTYILEARWAGYLW
jgi:hypothetical protein